MALTPKERAINKTKQEIKKDIDRLVQLAKRCGLGELQYFLHYLHFVRLLPSSDKVEEDNKEMIKLYVRQLDEVYKYLIQVIIKYGIDGHIKNPVDNCLINTKLVHLMTKIVQGINSKFESLSFITMFNNVEVSGERDQHIKMDMEELLKYGRLKKFLYYGVRVDRENDFQKDNPKYKNDFLEYFRNEYKPYTDLFHKEFGVSVDEFSDFVDWILEKVIEQVKQNEDNFYHIDKDTVDYKEYHTILFFSLSLFLEKNVINEKFGDKFNKIIDRLTFRSAQFDEHQLKYNLIARQPIIEKEDFYIISPEVMLDSMLVNCHYSLLEATQLNAEYKKRYANSFVDKISSIANEQGYKEFSRELELYEGKNQIGDLDLVVKNDKGEFLLIEAKNHTLPMDVYFHDQESTEKRLTQLTKEWERKVERRYNHVKVNHLKYEISSNFVYIIVTKMPEILSHFSNYLVLSLDEFKQWVNKKNIHLGFEDLFNQIYKLDEVPFTEEQFNSIQNDLAIGTKFTKE